jgi:hypothetical protein
MPLVLLTYCFIPETYIKPVLIYSAGSSIGEGGHTTRAQILLLLARAVEDIPGAHDEKSWSPQHNPSLRPQTLTSLMCVF